MERGKSDVMYTMEFSVIIMLTYEKEDDWNETLRFSSIA